MENMFKVKSEKITSVLIQTPDMSPDQIRELIRSELGDDFYITIKKFLKFGFNFSFKTGSPFVSSGIFFRNILKIYPDFSHELSNTSPRFFKNMIMHKGDSKIQIKNYNDFLRIQMEFSQNFGLAAPKLDKIFEALLNDGNAIQKIIDNQICFNHVKKFFSHIPNEDWETRLKNEMIKYLSEKIETCEFKRRFEVDEKIIESIDTSIKSYQDEIAKFQTVENKDAGL